jgi:hypothetical protein
MRQPFQQDDKFIATQPHRFVFVRNQIFVLRVSARLVSAPLFGCVFFALSGRSHRRVIFTDTFLQPAGNLA